MENRRFILCQTDSCDGIFRAVDEIFGTSLAGEEGNRGTLHNGDLTVEITAYGQDLGEECAEFIKKQVNMVCGHFAQVETEHVDVKINALHQLTGSKGFVCIDYSYPGARSEGAEDAIRKPLFALLGKVHGLMLSQDGSKLLEEHGKLLLSDEGESELAWFMPYERPLPEHFFDGAPADAMDRRNESLALCREKHIHVTEWLPLIETEAEANFPAPEEIAGRAAALLIVALYSECLLAEHMSAAEARDFVAPIIEGYGADAYFSAAEKAYLDKDDSSEQERIQYIWQYEPLLVMLWALGYQEDLFFPDHICDVPEVARMMRERPSIEALLADANARTKKELLDEADLIYRLDWACVDTRIHGLPAPAGMDGGVVMERHKALNWLIMGGDWDNVDTST